MCLLSFVSFWQRFIAALPSVELSCVLFSPFSVEGPIPEALGHLHSLQELWLNGNRLTGTIPARLGYLSQLRELYLNANELVGPIPRSFSELTNLEALNLSWNQLIGGFPSFLGNMVRICNKYNYFNDII